MESAGVAECAEQQRGNYDFEVGKLTGIILFKFGHSVCLKFSVHTSCDPRNIITLARHSDVMRNRSLSRADFTAYIAHISPISPFAATAGLPVAVTSSTTILASKAY